MRKEALVTDRARLGIEHLRRTCSKQPFVGDRAQIDQAAGPMSAGEGRVDLLPYLITTGAGTGADHRHHVSLPANLSQSANPLLEHAVREPAPTGVKCRHGAARAQRHWDAVAGKHHRRQARCRERVTVSLEYWLECIPTPPWALAVREDLAHDGAVYLIATHQTLHAKRLTQALTGLEPVLRTISTDT
jgi:hypothetical protein